jgi:lipoprotein-anchoring transpeptidase ErfK/SrfK
MFVYTRRHIALLGVAVLAVLAFQSGSAAVKSEPAALKAATAKHQQAVQVSPPVVRIDAKGDERGVAPVDSVRVAATSGTLADVSMINEQGKTVNGAMAPDRTAWTPAEPLGYGRTYTLSVTGRGTDTTTTRQVSRFSTVVPDNQTRVSLTSTSGAALAEGATYGVGQVIVARFDEDIPDRAAAERQLQVRTSPPVEGAWSWVNDRKAHWRPREHFPPGTQVTAAARIYGVDLGGGIFGEQDTQVNFRIGPSHVTIADDATKQVSVYENGRLVRTMPTSMGRGGTETVDGNTIHFWTQRGVYTVMDKANPVLMDSSTYGLPIDSPSGYRISVPYATRISPDGIYLHEREATVWAQGNTNVSAGCLNLSAENAEWFYNFSAPGDVVEIRNTGGEPLQQWQNGDWSVPWDQWLLGSALRA